MYCAPEVIIACHLCKELRRYEAFTCLLQPKHTNRNCTVTVLKIHQSHIARINQVTVACCRASSEDFADPGRNRKHSRGERERGRRREVRKEQEE